MKKLILAGVGMLILLSSTNLLMAKNSKSLPDKKRDCLRSCG